MLHVTVVAYDPPPGTEIAGVSLDVQQIDEAIDHMMDGDTFTYMVIPEAATNIQIWVPELSDGRVAAPFLRRTEHGVEVGFTLHCAVGGIQ